MKLQEWKRKELNRLLMEKFNLSDSHCTGNRDDEEGDKDEEVVEEDHDCASHPGQTHGQWLEEDSK